MSRIQCITVSLWLHAKVQRQVAERGAFHAAKNLRKQGYPLHLALSLITGRA